MCRYPNRLHLPMHFLKQNTVLLIICSMLFQMTACMSTLPRGHPDRELQERNRMTNDWNGAALMDLLVAAGPPDDSGLYHRRRNREPALVLFYEDKPASTDSTSMRLSLEEAAVIAANLRYEADAALPMNGFPVCVSDNDVIVPCDFHIRRFDARRTYKLVMGIGFGFVLLSLAAFVAVFRAAG